METLLLIREPWTVVVKTTIDTHFVNQKSFDDALDALIVLALKIDETVDQQSLEGKLRKNLWTRKRKPNEVRIVIQRCWKENQSFKIKFSPDP